MIEENLDNFEIQILSLQVPQGQDEGDQETGATTRGGASPLERVEQQRLEQMMKYRLEEAQLVQSTMTGKEFKTELTHFLMLMDQSLAHAQRSQDSGLELSEVEMTVGIDGKGKFGLVGFGMEAGAKGSIRLLFKRPLQNNGQ